MFSLGHECPRLFAVLGRWTPRLMNRIEKAFGLTSQARVRYGDGDFTVLSAGDFVRCAVSGEPIALPNLKYWSVELQEAYASADISFKRAVEVQARKGAR